MPEDTGFLIQAIKATHGADAEYETTTPVTETFNGGVMWEGEVQTFRLLNHPKAQVAYAWSYAEGGQRHATAVLGGGKIDSPRMAVRAAIAAKRRRLPRTYLSVFTA